MDTPTPQESISRFERVFGRPTTTRDRRGLLNVAAYALAGAAIYISVIIFHIRGPLGGLLAAGSIFALLASYLAAWDDAWKRVRQRLLRSTWGDGRRFIVALLMIAMVLLGPIGVGVLVGILLAQ